MICSIICICQGLAGQLFQRIPEILAEMPEKSFRLFLPYYRCLAPILRTMTLEVVFYSHIFSRTVT